MNDSRLNTNSSSTKENNHEELSEKYLELDLYHICYTPLTSKIIASIAKNFEDIIVANYNESVNNHFIRNDVFNTNDVLMISIEDYIKRIFYNTNMDINTLVIGVIYIDKMCEENQYVLTLGNIHRIILAGCILAIQFNEDETFKKDYYAKVGSVNVELLNNLIYQFYIYMDFNLLVKEELFREYFNFFTGNL